MKAYRKGENPLVLAANIVLGLFLQKWHILRIQKFRNLKGNTKAVEDVLLWTFSQ